MLPLSSFSSAQPFMLLSFSLSLSCLCSFVSLFVFPSFIFLLFLLVILLFIFSTYFHPFAAPFSFFTSPFLPSSVFFRAFSSSCCSIFPLPSPILTLLYSPSLLPHPLSPPSCAALESSHNVIQVDLGRVPRRAAPRPRVINVWVVLGSRRVLLAAIARGWMACKDVRRVRRSA